MSIEHGKMKHVNVIVIWPDNGSNIMNDIDHAVIYMAECLTSSDDVATGACLVRDYLIESYTRGFPFREMFENLVNAFAKSSDVDTLKVILEALIQCIKKKQSDCNVKNFLKVALPPKMSIIREAAPVWETLMVLFRSVNVIHAKRIIKLIQLDKLLENPVSSETLSSTLKSVGLINRLVKYDHPICKLSVTALRRMFQCSLRPREIVNVLKVCELTLDTELVLQAAKMLESTDKSNVMEVVDLMMLLCSSEYVHLIWTNHRGSIESLFKYICDDSNCKITDFLCCFLPEECCKTVGCARNPVREEDIDTFSGNLATAVTKRIKECFLREIPVNLWKTLACCCLSGVSISFDVILLRASLHSLICEVYQCSEVMEPIVANFNDKFPICLRTFEALRGTLNPCVVDIDDVLRSVADFRDYDYFGMQELPEKILKKLDSGWKFDSESAQLLLDILYNSMIVFGYDICDKVSPTEFQSLYENKPKLKFMQGAAPCRMMSSGMYCDSVSYVDGSLYRNTFESECQTALVTAMTTQEEKMAMFDDNTFDNIDNDTVLSFALRVFKPEGFAEHQLCVIRNNVKYPLRKNVSLLTGLLRSYGSLNDLENSHVVEIQTGPGDHRKLHLDDKYGSIVESLLALFDKLHDMYPDLRFHNDNFSEWMNYQAQSVTMTMGGFNLVSQLALRHPYLIDFDLRVFIMKVMTSQLETSMGVHYPMRYHTQPFQPSLSRRRATTVCAVIRRSHIFEDGKAVMRLVGPCYQNISVRFAGEDGKGSGPAHEFMVLYSREFALTSRNMWRNDSCGQKYAYTANGLFPSPEANSDDFYDLGILCAKAITMNMLIELPCNPAFFDMVAGRDVSVSAVDPDLSKGLESPDALIDLPFVYPGTDLELVENGFDVYTTEESVARYVELVKSWTCGKQLREKVVEPFMRGWTEVMEEDFLRMFTGEEMVSVLCGSIQKITFNDLFQNVQMPKSEGFKNPSQLFRDFCQVISDMPLKNQRRFLMFVTGSSQIPIGGLRNLPKRITIEHKSSDNPDDPEDNYLPSAQTCSHTLKLPSYSNIEIMKTKLSFAIEHGNEEFLFV